MQQTLETVHQSAARDGLRGGARIYSTQNRCGLRLEGLPLSDSPREVSLSCLY